MINHQMPNIPIIYFLFKVMFCFIVRMSVQFGCIINPLIYATTIPRFKIMIQYYLCLLYTSDAADE